MDTLWVWAVSHHPLSLWARVYGNITEFAGGLRQRSTTVDFRTAYGHVANWVRSCGRTQCDITGASLESFSRILVGCPRYYEQDNTWHAWMNMARGQQCLQLPKTVFTSHRNRPSTVYLVCGQGKEIFTCKRPGSSQSQKKESTADAYALSQIGLHTTMHQYASFSFALWISGKPCNCWLLVRCLWMLDTFLQHTIEVARTKTVARLLGFGVV